jgi:hypothetical protein
MTCDVFRLPDGQSAIVCSRRRRTPRCWCAGCGAPGTYQCDAPVPARKSGTCDRHICNAHRTIGGQDIDFCPEHSDARVLL